MRILFFTSLKATHARKWLTALAATHEVHVATFSYTAADEIPGVTIHALQGKKDEVAVAAHNQTQANIRRDAWLTLRIGYRFGKQLGALIDEVRPDIVHAHQSIPFGWYAYCALKNAQTRSPFVVSVWGTDVIGYPNATWLYRWMNRRVLGKASHITATGTYLRQQASRWVTRDTDITIIPFGVDQARFTKKSLPANHARVFGMAKQLRPHMYGIDLAINALALARKIYPDMRLEIAGAGPDEVSLKKSAQEVGVAGAVRWLGHVPQEKIVAVFHGWDAYLLPSREESFGVAALEAQAVGLPILASRVGGIPEAVDENVTARFVEPLTAETLAAAMVALADDAAFVEQAFRAGPAFVAKHFTWQRSVSLMNQFYERITV